MHLRSHRRAPHPHILLYMLMLVLMLIVSKSRRVPQPRINLLMLFLAVELYKDGEHAKDFQQNTTISPHDVSGVSAY